MKLLFLCARIPYPATDGGAQYVYQTARSLQQAGHDIYMGCFHSAKHPQDAEALNQQFPVAVVDGEFREYGPAALIGSMLSGKPATISHRIRPHICLALLDAVLARFGKTFDLVIIEGVHMAEMIPLLRRNMPNVPIVLRQANAEFVILQRNAETASNLIHKTLFQIQAALMKRYEIRTLGKVDGATFISEVDRDQFAFLPLRYPTFVASPGVDIPAVSVAPRAPQRLLALASWKWLPNQEGLRWFLDHAWADLHHNYPDCRLDIVGGGLPPHPVIDQNPDHITYHGFAEDLTPFLATSTAMIFPLFSGSGIKIKLLEAMAWGLPVVTTPLAAEGITITPGEHYLAAQTSGEFLEQTGKLLENPELVDQIGAKARAHMLAHYSWPQRADELTAYLSTCTLRKS
jgi:polysaccharide biosynthesis protein PslH